MNSESGNPLSQDNGVFGLYDEVRAGPDDPPIKTNDEIRQNQQDDLYDEVSTQDSPAKSEKKEVESVFVPDPSHVYAKPEKKSRSLKRDRVSKKKLIPGLMDVGEVDIVAETEAAGGRETLERGMTKPMGDRFAIEDLKDAIKEFDEEINNNENGKLLPDFDVNQNKSAFELLVRFFETYEG